MNIHGRHAPSLAQKIFFAANHVAAISASAWVLFGNGYCWLSQLSGLTLRAGDFPRRALLLSAAVIYFARLVGTGYLLSRKISWLESVMISAWLYVLYGIIFGVGGQNTSPLGIGAVLGSVLYLGGSYLNTASEYQRYRWRQRPENHGHLYTGGYFRWSMHINYFGDSLLFTGFAVMTGSAWVLFVPGAMVAAFVGYHIPVLDAYLARRYGAEFEAYAHQTRKFVPGVY